MNKLLLLLCLFTLTNISFGLDDFYKTADTFFKTYVIDGKVNYKAVKSEGRSINELIDHISTSEYSEEEEKAYLVNVYNLYVIYQIVENYGKIKQPTDLTDFFTGKNVVLNNEVTSLDAIENEMIRKKYNDPRVHFVLVCGAMGCPPITNFAYTPEKIEEQLEAQTKYGMNRESFVYEKDGINYISQIFEWFQNDFGKNKDEVIKYINEYRTTPLNETNKVKYYPYNWNINETKTPIAKNNGTVSLLADPLNDNSKSDSSSSEETENTVTPDLEETDLQTFNAGSLLRFKQMDFTMFNTIYTETKSNWLGTDFDGFRGTFATHLIQWSLGVSKNRRINMGIDLNVKATARNSNTAVSGVFRPYTFKNNDSTRFGLTSVGLRIKVQPFKAVSDFSIQSTIYAPTVKDPEGSSTLGWAEWDRITWWNQIFYSKSFSKFQLFTELDFLFRFKKHPHQIGMLDIPMSVFFSYFPTSKITLYAMTQHVPRLTNNIQPQEPAITDWVVPMNYTASGLGFKYNFTSQLNVELLYTNFWRGKNTGLGSTFNLGIKFLTN